VEGDRVSHEVPEVGGEEVEDGRHHLLKHVRVEAHFGKSEGDGIGRTFGSCLFLGIDHLWILLPCLLVRIICYL
jgi:hypothetical protein